MERDRSLDEFLGGGSDDADEGDDAGGSEDADDGGVVDPTGDGAETDLAGDESEVAAGDATERESGDAGTGTTPDDDEDGAAQRGTDDDATTLDPDAVDPATVTYRWTPAGEPCDRCGARVERRWRDDGAYVCGDCKEW